MVRFGRLPGGSSRATAWLLTLSMTALPLVAAAQAYQPGDVIEYKVRGAWPVKWERGVFIRELPGGKQVLIHEKPSEFFPKGPEIAFDPLEIRRPGAPAPNPAVPGTKAPADPVGPLPLPPQPREPKRGGAEAALPRDCPAGGLMGKEEVISFAGATIGADPWKNPPRDDNKLPCTNPIIGVTDRRFSRNVKLSPTSVSSQGALSCTPTPLIMVQ